jgi:hypothetical protein
MYILHAKVATMFRVQQKQRVERGAEKKRDIHAQRLFVLDASEAFVLMQKCHTKSKITPSQCIIYTCLWTKFIYHQKMSSNSEVRQKKI